MEISLDELNQKLQRALIDLISVTQLETRSSLEGDQAMYIKTSDLSTVDTEGLEQLVDELSSSSYKLRYLIPSSICGSNGHVKNIDSVILYIQVDSSL